MAFPPICCALADKEKGGGGGEEEEQHNKTGRKTGFLSQAVLAGGSSPSPSPPCGMRAGGFTADPSAPAAPPGPAARAADTRGDSKPRGAAPGNPLPAHPELSNASFGLANRGQE